MPWWFTGLQLALLFIPVSNQACNSCDQLLEEGELGGEGAAPGLLPRPSRMLSVHLSVCLFLLLTLFLGLFCLFMCISFQILFFLFPCISLGNWEPPHFDMNPSEQLVHSGQRKLQRAPTEYHPPSKLQLVVRCSVMVGEKPEFSQTWLLALTSC